MEKRRNCSYKGAISLLFHNILNIQYISLTSYYICLLNVVVRIIFPQFCKSDIRGTDISKYFRKSLGIRDNESRLYFTYLTMKSYDVGTHRGPSLSTYNITVTGVIRKQYVLVEIKRIFWRYKRI